MLALGWAALRVVMHPIAARLVEADEGVEHAELGSVS